MTPLEEAAILEKINNIQKGIDNWEYLSVQGVGGEYYCTVVRPAKIARKKELIRKLEELLQRKKNSGAPGAAQSVAAISRANYLQNELKQRKWNKHRLASESGCNHKTIQRILDRKHVVENTLEKIRNVLPLLP